MNQRLDSVPLRSDRPTLLIDLLLGAGLSIASTFGWIAVCVAFETREAWDRGVYFIVVLPILWATAALAGWRRPRHAWRWAAALVAGQALGLGITNHGWGTLGPLPLVALAVLCGPCFLAANWAARRAIVR